MPFILNAADASLTTLHHYLANICMCNLCSNSQRRNVGIAWRAMPGNLPGRLYVNLLRASAISVLGQCPSYHVPYAGIGSLRIRDRTRELVVVLAIGACSVAGEPLNSPLTHYVRSASSATSSSPHLCQNVFKKLND